MGAMSQLSSRPPRHLHVFGLSLILIVGVLVLFLFGVRMEATAPATGVATSTHILTLRASRAGLVMLKDPVAAAGTTLNGGQPLTTGESTVPILVPNSHARWLVLELLIGDGQRVQEGDIVATLVPIDPESGALQGIVFRLEIEEKNVGAIEPGQEVRLSSNMYPHRTHGLAKGVVERLEPMGVAGPNGSRLFHGWVRVTESPFPIKLGSSVHAEVVLGKKRTYQIILEH